MRIRRVLLALSMVVIIAACGDDDDGGSAATDAPAAGATDGTTAGADSGAALTIAGNAFSPKELTAPAGSIAITNEDGVTHTVTSPRRFTSEVARISMSAFGFGRRKVACRTS